MTTSGTPSADIEIDEDLVRQLVCSQFSHLAELPLVLVDQGWDNATYRLGKDLAVRVPRRQVAAGLIQNEQRFLPLLAPALPIPTPVPIHMGKATQEFPWSWSIVPWIDGLTADLSPPGTDQAIPFAEFLRALHGHSHAESAPRNTFRGVPLMQKAPIFEESYARLQNNKHIIDEDILRIWKRALAAPPSTKSCWLHGDLHARNAIIRDGKVAGIIDWGDMTSGDPATDLASVWSLFETADVRNACLEHYRATTDEIIRAQGWATFFAIILLETGLVDHPAHAEMGRIILSRIIEDEE